MPSIDGDIVPLLYWRYTDGFAAYDWGREFQTSYEVAQQIDSLLREAGAKGMSLVVQVALVKTEELYPDKPKEVSPETGEESPGPVPEEPAT